MFRSGRAGPHPVAGQVHHRHEAGRSQRRHRWPDFFSGREKPYEGRWTDTRFGEIRLCGSASSLLQLSEGRSALRVADHAANRRYHNGTLVLEIVPADQPRCIKGHRVEDGICMGRTSGHRRRVRASWPAMLPSTTTVPPPARLGSDVTMNKRRRRPLGPLDVTRRDDQGRGPSADDATHRATEVECAGVDPVPLAGRGEAIGSSSRMVRAPGGGPRRVRGRRANTPTGPASRRR